MTEAEAEPTPREQLEALAQAGASVSAQWVLANIEELVGKKFDLPHLALTPLDPIDVAGQEHPGRTDTEIKQDQIEARAKALKPAPGQKPRKITVT